MKINTTKILAVCLLMISTTAMAVPAKRVKKTVTLADGTKKEVVLMGDENMHFYQDAENNVYTRNSDGVCVKRDKELLQSKWQERLAQRNKHRMDRAVARGMNLTPKMARENSVRRRAQWGAEQNPVSGDKKGLVILVNFPDLKMDSEHGQKFYDGFFNEVGFNKGGNSGSVHDYFYECSYGDFNLTFDVYGPVTVKKSYTYYGQNDSGNNDMYVAELAAEACQLVSEMGVDFSKYDWDNDKEVDQVFLIYAGYGEHAGAPENTIWPHECTLSELAKYGDGPGALTLGGIKIDTYAMTSELDGFDGNTPAGIGTACHEFSHCMCLPDFYDTVGNRYGMDAWDLMDYGSYSGPNSGGCPAPYTSYERMYCGWLNPVELNDRCQIIDMKSLYDEAREAYIIYNKKNPNEYYLLENRQDEGFGAYNPAHGLLVLHVYFDSEVWSNNEVNGSSTQRMTVIPADGRLSRATNSADTWPGTTGNTALTDTSSPAATLYTANVDGRKFMGKPIEDIEESEGKISFSFNGGVNIDIPVATEATDISLEGFTANWMPVEGATGYKVQLTATELVAQEYSLADLTLMEEDFSGFKKGTGDGSKDIGESLDDYTKVPGWEGYKLYTTATEEVKMGTGSSEGYIFSPWLTSESGEVTLVFTVRKYKNDTEPVYLYIGADEEPDCIDEIDLTSNSVRHLVTTTIEDDEWYWGLYCEKRCYISEMCAYEGKVTEEQIASGTVSKLNSETSVVVTDGTSYQFTGLSPQRKYEYCVKTIASNGQSKWSNSIEVELKNTTSIKGLTPTLSEGEGAVYDLSGRKVQGARSKGLYIINGKKVVR